MWVGTWSDSRNDHLQSGLSGNVVCPFMYETISLVRLTSTYRRDFSPFRSYNIWNTIFEKVRASFQIRQCLDSRTFQRTVSKIVPERSILRREERRRIKKFTDSLFFFGRYLDSIATSRYLEDREIPFNDIGRAVVNLETGSALWWKRSDPKLVTTYVSGQKFPVSDVGRHVVRLAGQTCLEPPFCLRVLLQPR